MRRVCAADFHRKFGYCLLLLKPGALNIKLSGATFCTA
jgi:hypothetical protein